METNPHRAPSIASPVIIVIDDDAAVRNSLKFSLEIEGFSVRTYSSPNEVLSGGALPASSCLIVDQNMPGMSGLSLLAALRKRGVHTPAILVSAHVTSSLKDEAARAGLPVVEKPFLGNMLIDGIHAAITKNGR
jgi:two-component system response regulator FixJ